MLEFIMEVSTCQDDDDDDAKVYKTICLNLQLSFGSSNEKQGNSKRKVYI